MSLEELEEGGTVGWNSLQEGLRDERMGWTQGGWQGKVQ